MGQNNKIKAQEMNAIKRQKKNKTVLCSHMAKLFVRLQIVGSQKETHKQVHIDKKKRKKRKTVPQ